MAFRCHPLFALNAVEPLDQQHILAAGRDQGDRGDIEAAGGSQFHGDKFRFHDAVEVRARRKLRDQFAIAVIDQGLGAGAADRCPVIERLVERRCQLHAFLDVLCGF